MKNIDVLEGLIIGSFFVIPLGLWVLSRFSSSSAFRRCHTAFLILYAGICLLYTVPFQCDGSILDRFQNCIYMYDWLVNDIYMIALYGFFLTIAAYVLVMTTFFLIFLYKNIKEFRNKTF
jgi:hypothetical protein